VRLRLAVIVGISNRASSQCQMPQTLCRVSQIASGELRRSCQSSFILADGAAITASSNGRNTRFPDYGTCPRGTSSPLLQILIFGRDRWAAQVSGVTIASM